MIYLGHSEYGTEVQGYEPMRSGGGCNIITPPICTAAAIDDLDWYIHGHNMYYVTIKVENTAGLYTKITSQPYTHDVQLASAGVVIDTKNDVRYLHSICLKLNIKYYVQ